MFTYQLFFYRVYKILLYIMFLNAFKHYRFNICNIKRCYHIRFPVLRDILLYVEMSKSRRLSIREERIDTIGSSNRVSR